ncbi:MAG TPA: hypothetical protein P5277_04460 [Candidatus Paceibacterota bacterium]|nr:hypothetical protein [Candidatus Paceibacterota bacterium]
MKRKHNGTVFREARIAILRTVYDLTKENPEIYYHPSAISAGTPRDKCFGCIYSSNEVYELIENWVDTQLVQEVRISNYPHPTSYDTKPIRGYRANLEKEEDIRRKLRLKRKK